MLEGCNVLNFLYYGRTHTLWETHSSRIDPAVFLLVYLLQILVIFSIMLYVSLNPFNYLGKLTTGLDLGPSLDQSRCNDIFILSYRLKRLDKTCIGISIITHDCPSMLIIYKNTGASGLSACADSSIDRYFQSSTYDDSQFFSTTSSRCLNPVVRLLYYIISSLSEAQQKGLIETTTLLLSWLLPRIIFAITQKLLSPRNRVVVPYMMQSHCNALSINGVYQYIWIKIPSILTKHHKIEIPIFLNITERITLLWKDCLPLYDRVRSWLFILLFHLDFWPVSPAPFLLFSTSLINIVVVMALSWSIFSLIVTSFPLYNELGVLDLYVQLGLFN